MTLTRIISGGQTGADRAGLDFAIDHDVEESVVALDDFLARHRDAVVLNVAGSRVLTVYQFTYDVLEGCLT